jgi:ribosomal protein S12 methylthiotransferase accessory factor
MLRLHSSLRSRPAAQTWEAASPRMPELGISRVTDVTRMDRLGLPVYISVRPRGQALCVHAGKGVLPEEARIGALMEAVEYAAAEPQRTRWRARSLRVDELEARWSGDFDLFDLAPRLDAGIEGDRRVTVVRCEHVAGGRATWLPAELVFVPFDDPHGPTLFGWSTNGLASGNSVAEATLHGLLEVLERDALAMNLPEDASRWLEPDDLPEPFAGLARDWRGAGVALSVRCVPNAFGLPCFRAMLEEGQGQTIDLAVGSGLHLDAGIALARAICEAAQSRLSHIHGGRDDITRFYDRLQEQGASRDARRTLAYREAFDRRRRAAWRDVPCAPVSGSSVEQVLDELLSRLGQCGFPTVIRHVFDIDLGDLAVVKVVVPRCQEVEGPLHRMGRRLYERAVAHA